MWISGNSAASPVDMLGEIIFQTTMSVDGADRVKAVDSILQELFDQSIGISINLAEKLHNDLYKISDGNIPTEISSKLKYLSTTALTSKPVERKLRTVQSLEATYKHFNSMHEKLKKCYDENNLIEFEELFERFTDQGFQANQMTYSQFIKLQINAGDFIRAIETFENAVAVNFPKGFYLGGKEVIRLVAQLIENGKTKEALKVLNINKGSSRAPQYYVERQLFALLEYYKEENKLNEAADLWIKLMKHRALARKEFKVGFQKKLRAMNVKIAQPQE